MNPQPVAERGPFSGLRVIELGGFIAAGFCGQLLADFGAEVVKVEDPVAGDPIRTWGVHKLQGRSLWWPVIGRNKRCITLNLRRPEGQAIARRLILKSDVLIENFRPGTLKEWNLDPEDLQRERPELIVGRISGFGQTGPYRERPGFAAVAEAMAGLRFVTGFPDRPPARVALSIGDSLAGLFTAFGIVTALYARINKDGSGKGQEVDVGITDSVIAILESIISEYSATGKVRQRNGMALAGLAPSNLYPTRDGHWVVIAANSNPLFKRLTAAMGVPELASDPRFQTHNARGDRQEELDQIVSAWTSGLTSDELIEKLEEHQVPTGPLNDAAAVTADPHFRARQSVIDVETEEFGTLSMQGVVPKLSGTPGQVEWTGPRIGEHNREIYTTLLDLTEAEFVRLQKEGII
jgi:crotonobetainyl-CoA:carnitine CoA-transferase CaiB-like acyl-CoA transferase